ncbi:DNA-binding bromodomain-containing family protein [Dorcoceras hygrometricum]|nr:DNA-binding bromodomain-containing family protein [Dorcoceras hygrometricum]
MEKRKLGLAIAQLCPENLSKALEIVALNNPNFQAKAEEVELDINAQSESTLWRLKYFLKDVLKVKSKDQNNDNTFREAANNQENNIVSKRKREICDALAKTAKKRKKQHSS